MKKGIGNVVLKLALGIVDSLLSLKLAVILDRHEIKLKTVDEEEKDADRYYDSDHYLNGNIYIKENSNPVKPDRHDDEVNLISSAKYKKFFKMKVLDNIARLSEGALEVKGWKAMLILIAITLMVSVFQLMLLLGA